MLYLALISSISKDESTDPNDPLEATTFITLATEASTIDEALDKVSQKLIKLHEEDDSFADLTSFYLDDFVEVDSLDDEAHVVNYFSVSPFGNGICTLYACNFEGNPALSHYAIGDEDDLEDEETKEAVPFLEI